jgi:uncharacterized membrane protein YgaE (UPF0421/DUF939 family)
MIKFFRKIRQNLLMENKTGKYFKYAIGEIILVVIGILIALSINNWNENRKSNIAELETYQRIINDLKTESSKVQKSLDGFDRNKALYFQIYNETQGKATYDSTFDHQSLRTNPPFDLIIVKNYTEASIKINNVKLKNN